MEVIGKIKNLITEGEHAIIKVIAYKEIGSTEWIEDIELIMTTIGPRGDVFEPGFGKNYTYKEKEYINCKIKLNTKVNQNDVEKAHYQIDSVKGQIEYRLFETDHILLNDNFIDLDFLNSQSENFSDKFYLEFNSKYYGPFKKIEGKIYPKVGKSVNIHTNIKCIKDEEITLIIQPPVKPSGNIQVETDKQIIKWFIEIVRNINHPLIDALRKNPDWKNELSEVISNEKGIDKLRMELAINNIDNIDLTYSELRNIGKYSPKVQEIITDKIIKYSAEIKEKLQARAKDRIVKGNVELEDLIKEKEVIQKDLISLKQNNLELKEINKQISNEIDYLNDEKERIIHDFKIKVGANSPAEVLPKNFSLEFKMLGSQKYQSKISLLNNIVNSMQFHGISQSKESIKNNLFCLALNKGLLSQSMELVLSLLSGINNCVIKYINVEANWLNYSNLEKTNYFELFKKATDNPNQLHTIILRDFNLSSPECYARPLIDFHDSIIPKLYDEITIWPANLKVIGIVQPYPEVGLPILENTFKNWVGLNCSEIQDVEKKTIINEEYASFDWLLNEISNSSFENSINEYFKEL